MDMKLLANEVIVLWDQYNLHEWTFVLGRSKTRLGVCRYGPKEIEVSEVHARNDKAEVVLDTLKHEIAHALVGPGNGHNEVWRTKAREVGCSPDACVAKSEDESLYRPPGKWFAVCPGCSHEFNWHRKPKHLIGKYHMKCGSDRGMLTVKQRV